MNNETLIRLITAEVLKRLGNAPPSKPRVGVVLSATASEGALQSLRSVSERGFVIDRIAVGMRAPESLKRAAATYGQMVDGNVAGTRFSADSRALIAPELSS
ncbi:MAG: hypothetical protein O3A46_10175, partial [Candidatus Poribacteria bacterium]|nr:hypothetical protein [Candidatus Poribacteria bacterium]